MGVDIFHIYWGTAGNAGLYLDEIYQVLDKASYKQKAFVNYYYPFDYGNKVFYKLTELGHCKVKHFRGPIRYLELLWAMLRILVCTIIDRPKIINYSIIGSFDVVRYYLLFSKKVLGCKIVLTCHDVVPFASNTQKYDTEIRIRKKLFSLADYLLVHNEYSVRQLEEVFAVETGRIVMHLFPIMDVSRLVKSNEVNYTVKDFLFIGHLRREKGVDVLLEAWESVHKECPNATLRIAGNLPTIESLDLSKYSGRKDVDFVIKFLSDEEYCGLIKAARFVVLPYKMGTNSGVVSTVLSLDSEVIASDIPMFVQNPLLEKSYIFKTGDSMSLAQTLKKAYRSNCSLVKQSFTLSQYREEFEKGIIEVYKQIQ